MKFSFDFKTYLSAIKESEAMTVLNDVPGVQRLVGVCPERFMIVTEYGGPILYNWLRNSSELLAYEWIDIATKIIKIFKAIH